MDTRCAFIVASALVGVSCFAVEPLPTCDVSDGLVAPYHVCMPRSAASLPLDYAPRQLLAGNFDGESIDADGDGAPDVDVVDDLALLIDESTIAVFSAPTPGGEQLALSGLLGGVSARIERMTAARFYGKAGRGQDLFAVTGPVQSAAGSLLGWTNQGPPTLFDAQANDIAEVGDSELCPIPTGVHAMYLPGELFAGGLLVACSNDGPGVLAVTASAFLYQNVDGALGPSALPLLTKYAHLRAGAVAPLDGLGLDDIIFSFDAGEDDHLGVVLVGVTPSDVSIDEKKGEALEVPLASGEVSALIAVDLDEDGDVDLAAVHPQAGVISIVRQKRSEPLTFEAAETIPLGGFIDDVIVGDFSRDGRLDLAVAHAYADTGVSVISFLIRQPDALPGSTAYGFAPATFGLGEITDLEPIDLDGDGWLDIAAAFKIGNKGSIEVYLNRSPAGE